MTHYQKLQKLKEKIIEAVPGVMELKFGCEIEIIDKNLRKYFVGKNLIVVVDNGLNFKAVDIVGNSLNDVWFVKKYCKILGRPITLEDVLITVDKIGFVDDDSGYDWIFNKIVHIKDGIGDGDTYRVFDYIAWFGWKWNKPLDQQRPETIDFLYNLICKNE